MFAKEQTDVCCIANEDEHLHKVFDEAGSEHNRPYLHEMLHDFVNIFPLKHSCRSQHEDRFRRHIANYGNVLQMMLLNIRTFFG